MYFSSKSNLTSHIKTVHQETTKEHRCNVCFKGYKTLTNLNEHISRVHAQNEASKFSCNPCEKTFVSKQTLKHHFKKIHKIVTQQANNHIGLS